jgi:hypothetical protein
LCLKVDLAGIQPNPWQLGDACLDDCGYWIWQGGSSYVQFEVLSLAGVNGGHFFSNQGIYVAPTNILMRVVRLNGCDRYSGMVLGNNMRIVVGIGCSPIRDRLEVGSVSVFSQTGVGPLFEWNAAPNPATPIEVGGSITVQNQLPECSGIVGGSDNTIGPAGFGGSATITVLSAGDDCEPTSPTNVYAYTCDGTQRITVDITTNTVGGWLAKIGETLFIPSGEESPEVPWVVEWVQEDCPPDTVELNKIATPCRGTDPPIVYDPKLAPSGAQTCLYQDRRYDLTSTTTTEDAVDVEFSFRRCNGIVVPSCVDITGPDDPRCFDCVTYAHCARCGCGQDEPPDPRPRPTNERLPGERDDGTYDGPRFFNWGTLIAKAIKVLSANKVRHCSKCERRRILLDTFGEKVGRELARRLGI